jgi:hypothetical protein
MNRGVHASKRFPGCPYCKREWATKLQIEWLVARTDKAMETVVLCPCGKSGILMRMQVIEARLLDIEGAKHGVAEAPDLPVARAHVAVV